MIELLKELLHDSRSRMPFGGVLPRTLTLPLRSGKTVSLVGPRRAGKTFFLQHLINDLLADGVRTEQIVYVNFEDERLGTSTSTLQTLLDAQQQLHPDIDRDDCYFFFDEIQVIPGWEKFVRRMVESDSRNIFITGSSATLLSREIATALRGRTINYELLPLSFREFCRFSDLDPEAPRTASHRNRLTQTFGNFLEHGGYPEVVAMNAEIRLKTLQSYVDIMIFRDVIERHQVRNTGLVRALIHRVFATSSQIFSVHKFYRDLKSRGMSLSKDTLYGLIDHLAEAFIVIPVCKWSPSLLKREQALKKMYAIDSGLMTAYKLPTAEDRGYLLETVVCGELLKSGASLCYFANENECDFVVESPNQQVIQVCWELTQDNRSRELSGLVDAANQLSLKRGLVLTAMQEDHFEYGEIDIDVLPAWNWALSLK